MTTQRHYISIRYLALPLMGVLMLVVAFTSGCSKKCQAPATEKFKTITGQQWRLVETTDQDPNFKNLSTTTFLVFNFTVDYKGTVKLVKENTSYDTPVKTFIYNIDKDAGIIRLKYTDASQAAAQADPNATQSPDLAPQNSIVDYTYDLGRELEMTDSKGNYYRFVPFNGIIAPDNTCTF